VATAPIRIATRASALAVWQAEHVAALLRAAVPGVDLDLVTMSTEGDRRTDVPLSTIGGKGVFAKEVQSAVLEGRADLAVHSAKDLPALTPDGLVIGAVPERADARDALVGRRLIDLPPDAVVATGSARRRVQLAQLRPDLRFAELRGNMATRLDKAAGFDAIVVAAAALDRLGLAERVAERLAPSLFVPQVGQGTLAVECRAGDERLATLLAAIDHAPSRRVLTCERAFLVELGGDCSLPAGAHAAIGPDGTLHLRGVLGGVDPGVGSQAPLARGEARGDDAEALGRDLAVALRNQLGKS
jgi:hydroxymethylbilane synthase